MPPEEDFLKLPDPKPIIDYFNNLTNFQKQVLKLLQQILSELQRRDPDEYK